MTMSAKELQKKQQAAIREEWKQLAELVNEVLGGAVPADGRHRFLIPDSVPGNPKDNSDLKKIMKDAGNRDWNTECVKVEGKYWLICTVPEAKKSRKK